MKQNIISSSPNSLHFVKVTSFILFFISHYCFAQNYPLSDPSNTGNWELKTDLSDEFDQVSLDTDKWFIQGTGDVFVSNFIGRAPSQFSTENVRIENDKLKIQTKWDSTFNFSSTPQNGVTYENITTAAVIGKNYFQYGYMEIMCKAAKAEITSSFWTTGMTSEEHKSELDMFEMFGNPKDLGTNNENWKKRLKFNMISWDPNNYYYLPDGQGPAHTRNIQVDENVADDFHVYGFEWTADYIKVYVDGILHPDGVILKSDITNNGADPDRWVTDIPYKIWFDSETFPWLGIPEEADLPVDYEIEYIRVWQNEVTVGTPTTLLAGDIAFVGYNSSSSTSTNHDFAFMLLKDIEASTTINFCDRGWKNGGGWYTATGGSAYAVDDTVRWTADKAYSAGTIIRINQNKAFINEVEIGVNVVSQSLGTNFMTFNANGDVLYAYQGDEPVDISDENQFIAVLGMNGSLCSVGGNANGCLPSNLTLGTNALEITPEINNAVYKGKIIGTPSELRLSINNAANWESSDSTIYNLYSYASFGDVGVSGTLAIENSIDKRTDISIYPNPINTSENSVLNIKAPKVSNISIFTLTGKEIKNVVKTTETIQVSIENLSKGIYLLVLHSEDSIETKKIIIK